MSYPVNIAVDCMGGDDDASSLPGLLLTLKKYPNIKLQLYGDEEIIRSRISKYKHLNKRHDYSLRYIRKNGRKTIGCNKKWSESQASGLLLRL